MYNPYEEPNIFGQYEYGSQYTVGGSSAQPNIVRPKVATFCGVYDNVYRIYRSGANDADYLQKAQIEYQVEYGVPFTLLHCWEVLKKCDKWSSVEVLEFIAQKVKKKSKRYKSSGDSSFSTRDLGKGSFNLNSTAGDEEDEVQDVRPIRPMGRAHAKRKGKAGTSSTSSTIGVDVESLAKFMVNEYAMVNGQYNVQGARR
ncbi:RNA-directed DNA polymerase, eukaryota [Tanacetum coccineum]